MYERLLQLSLFYYHVPKLDKLTSPNLTEQARSRSKLFEVKICRLDYEYSLKSVFFLCTKYTHKIRLPLKVINYLFVKKSHFTN